MSRNFQHYLAVLEMIKRGLERPQDVPKVTESLSGSAGVVILAPGHSQMPALPNEDENLFGKHLNMFIPLGFS